MFSSRLVPPMDLPRKPGPACTEIEADPFKRQRDSQPWSLTMIVSSVVGSALIETLLQRRTQHRHCMRPRGTGRLDYWCEPIADRPLGDRRVQPCLRRRPSLSRFGLALLVCCALPGLSSTTRAQSAGTGRGGGQLPPPRIVSAGAKIPQ